MAGVNPSSNPSPLISGPDNGASQEMSETVQPSLVTPATKPQQPDESAPLQPDTPSEPAGSRPDRASSSPAISPLATDDHPHDNLGPFDHSLPPTPGASQHDAATPSYPALTPSTSTQQLQSKPPTGNGGGINPASKPLKKKGNVFVRLGHVWWPELVAALFVIILLVGEILILAHYDRKYLDRHWPHSWKINAVFAFITTFLEAAVMFYVGAALGQLRWHWFRSKEHRLKWLDIMTNARAPTGALRFLMTPGMYRQYAAIGAIIVLLLLGVSTFTQNVITQISFPRFMGNDTGSVPINTNYTWNDQGATVGIGDQAPIPQMIAAMQSGMYSFSNQQTKNNVAAYSRCQGDTCHFGSYNTLAVCGTCELLNRDVVHNPCPDGNCTSDDYYTLKEGGSDLSLVALNGILNITSDTKHPVTEPIRGQTGPLIVRMMAIVADKINSGNNTGAGASAIECAAWWCVQRNSAKIVNGTLHEDIEYEWTDTSKAARTTYLQEHDIVLTPPNCVINGSKSSNESYCHFHAGYATQAGIQNFLMGGNSSNKNNAFLSGSVTRHGHRDRTTWNSTTLLAGALAADNLAKEYFDYRVYQGFRTMAKFMSISIRETTTSVWDPVAGIYLTEYSYGYATNLEQRFNVRWPWITYPVVVVVISLIFLLTTIWITKDDEPWKSSVLSLMFHAFSDKDREHFGDVNGLEEMEELIRTQRVQLVQEPGKQHLLFHTGSVAEDHQKTDFASEQGARLGSHGFGAAIEFLDQGNFDLR